LNCRFTATPAGINSGVDYYTGIVSDKTDELRDIFMDVTDEETVTETQEDPRGSLAEDAARETDEEQLRSVIQEMREQLEFATDLADDDLVRVVRGFYEGESDAAIADALDVSRDVVFRARMDLHLVRDRDTDAPFDLDRLRELLDADATVAETADELDVSASTVRRYQRVVRAQNEARRVSERFRAEFEDAIADADLGATMTEEMKEDGLEEATEGLEAESDVSM
jgi:transposase-like protein